MADKPSVLFVCVHNAGRSQMAQGWLTHLASDRVEVRSAGSAPGERINVVAVEAMRKVIIVGSGTRVAIPTSPTTQSSSSSKSTA